jgi:hypothetical protein
MPVLFYISELPVVHATYLFEARVSLLLRISQRSECASKLVDFAIMETMKELTFLDERQPYNASQDEGEMARDLYYRDHFRFGCFSFHC